MAEYNNTDYNYTRDRLVKIPFLEKLPKEQFPTKTWIIQISKHLLKMLPFRNFPLIEDKNMIEAAFKQIVEHALKDKHARAKTVADFAACLVDKSDEVLSFLDFDEKSEITVSDRAFGEYRLSGPNPTTVKLATNEDLEAFGLEKDDTFLALVGKKELFVVDYSTFAKFAASSAIIPGIPKYTLGSMAMFRQENRSLASVCIKLIGHDGQSKLVYPDGPEGRVDFKWEIAKCVFQSNDSDFHEALVHLGGAHLVSEIFMVATYKKLPPLHPLHKLLTPHFEGTAFINDAADKALITDKGAVSQLASGSINEIREATKDFIEHITSIDMTFPERIRARQMDVENVPNLDYPYRDDGMLLWDAIHKWVTAYIHVFYPDDKAVDSDQILRGWIQELASEKGGNIKWLAGGVAGTNDGTGFQYTTEWLANLISTVIFTASVEHAAVNFPQEPYMQFAPAFPLGTYAGEPVCFKEHPTKEDYMSMLPPLTMGSLQANVGYLLGGVVHTKLGHYNEQAGKIIGTHYFKGIEGFPDNYIGYVDKALNQFHADLDEVRLKIEKRNQLRHPYTMMLPHNIPQSVNI